MSRLKSIEGMCEVLATRENARFAANAGLRGKWNVQGEEQIDLYQSGALLQSICHNRYEFWWLCNKDQNTVLVLKDNTKNSVEIVESAERLRAVGVVPAVAYEKLAALMERLVGVYRPIYEACVSGQSTAKAMLLQEKRNELADPTEAVRDCLEGLTAGSIVCIAWKCERAYRDDMRDVSREVKAAANRLRELLQSGALKLVDNQSFLNLNRVQNTMQYVGYCETLMTIQLTSSFDLDQFMAEIGPWIASARMA